MYKRNQLGYITFDDNFLASVQSKKLPPKLDEFEFAMLEAQLKSFGVPLGDKQSGGEYLGDVWMPAMLSDNIADHYEEMAGELLGPWEDSIATLAFGDRFSAKKLAKQTGYATFGELAMQYCKAYWTRFALEDNKLVVSYPSEICEDYAIYDCETFVKGSELAHPVIGTAINDKACYVWLHPQLSSLCKDPYMPMMPSIGRGKVLVAHNSAYDCARVAESFSLEAWHKPNTHNVWLCTMSMHQLVAGIDSDQRWAYTKQEGQAKPRWMQYGSPKSLVDAYNFHCGGNLDQGDKAIRMAFVDAFSMDDIREQLPALLTYAMADPEYTHELLQKLWPKYCEHAPSKVVRMAHILLANSALPVANDWFAWRDGVDKYCDALRIESANALKALTDAILAIPYEDRLEDAWYRHLPQNFVAPHSCKQLIVHYMLKLSWKGRPIRNLPKLGWCFALNEDEASECVAELDGKRYARVPHNKGEGQNLGNLFTSHFLNMHDNGTLKSELEGARRLCEIQFLLAYWTSTRNRVVDRAIKACEFQGFGQNIMKPFVVPHGTVSLRTNENLLHTTAAHNGKKPGCEIRQKIEAPYGHKLLCADWNSQELFILSAYSSSYVRISGATAFDFTNLVGDKANDTDMHSLVAKQVGIMRNAAKTANYALAYGGGKFTVSNAIKVWHPDFDKAKADKYAGDVIASFKGKRIERGSRYFTGGIASQAFNKMADIISEPNPRIPLLGTLMQPAIQPDICGQSGAPSQLNFTVQSSGSAMLQCLIVALTWLSKRAKLDARFCHSMHDEIIIRTSNRDAKLTAYCMQIAHCWGWNLLHYKLGIYDMPVSRAWFTDINCDETWRKDCEKTGDTQTFAGHEPIKAWSMKDIAEGKIGRASVQDILASRITPEA